MRGKVLLEAAAHDKVDKGLRKIDVVGAAQDADALNLKERGIVPQDVGGRRLCESPFRIEDLRPRGSSV